MLQSRYHKCRIIRCSVVTPDGRQTVAEERAGAPAAVCPKETPGSQQTPGAATFAAQVGGAGSRGHTLLSESGRTVGARAARLHHAACATYRTVSRWRPWGSCAHALVSPGETPPAQQWTLGARGVGTAPSAGSLPSFPGGRRSVRSGMSLLVTGAPTNGAAGPPPCVSAASSAAHGRTALDQCAYLQGRPGFPSSDASCPPCARRCRPRTLSASTIYGDTLLPCTPPPSHRRSHHCLP